MVGGVVNRIWRGKAKWAIEIEFYEICIIRSEADIFDGKGVGVVRFSHQFEWMCVLFSEYSYVTTYNVPS